MCDAIYIGNTQKTFNKRMDGNFSDAQTDKNKTFSIPITGNNFNLLRPALTYISV